MKTIRVCSVCLNKDEEEEKEEETAAALFGA